MGHSIIAVRVIRRDVTFIAPKKPDFRPIELIPERWGGQSRIQPFRGRASGQGERKGIPGCDGLMRMVKEVFRRGFHQSLGGWIDVYVPLARRHAICRSG